MCSLTQIYANLCETADHDVDEDVESEVRE